MSEKLEDRVRNIVAEKLNVEPERVTRGANFIDDLGADSLDITDMLLSLEKETGRSILENDANGMKTFGDLLDYLSKSEVASSQSPKDGFLRRMFSGLRRKPGAR